jgi:DNA-binding NarL/FixJ family response regulator
MWSADAPGVMDSGHRDLGDRRWESFVVSLSSADTAVMTKSGTTSLHRVDVQRRSRFGGYRRERPLWGIEALTPAEMRVARLAADGLSNPQIAATTGVTRGTIECQLQAVYRKLGIDRRQDLPELLDPAIAS